VVRTVRVVRVRVLTLAQLWLRVLALLAKFLSVVESAVDAKLTYECLGAKFGVAQVKNDRR